ncbi:PHB depolymerase family esterase [Sphingosinicella sp. BN140058]|uniref:extracellular catalytic domain type 1 short-chain-length polyhydroxyalkanoate depolymerase n=1 Tax=Sphingosinicella sp. BN140058 TaxID=1892855 RepID=UPI0010123895|nr:PHB depolymerase family esterase [Sphingosinicella sp. BN140058]QAY75097.1 PHB depolymerase family esterase [Sphingosinicella sp. BN140058]
MTSFSLKHMMEATRLTKAGRLAEATALLRTATGAPGSVDAAAKAQSAIIDLLPQGTGKHVWGEALSPSPAVSPSLSAKAAEVLSSFGLADGMPGLGDLGSLPGLQAVRTGAAGATGPIPEGARFEQHGFAGVSGKRAYKIYIPSRPARSPALIVMLHGCTQSADDFAAGTGMNAVAEERGFLVVYPEQPSSANASKCWNWFNVADQARDGGEAALLAGITRAVIAAHHVDPNKVFVAGLSAGGAAAAILGARYPDLFAAVGVHSGLACGAARDMNSAFAAMQRGGSRPQALSGGARPVRTIVFHGDADKTVNPVNGDQVVAQFAGRVPLRRTATQGVSPGGQGYTRTVHSDAAGAPMLEHWVVHGAGHAWSGGSAAGSYTDRRGPDASREMVRFFLGDA